MPLPRQECCDNPYEQPEIKFFLLNLNGIIIVFIMVFSTYLGVNIISISEKILLLSTIFENLRNFLV